MTMRPPIAIIAALLVVAGLFGAPGASAQTGPVLEIAVLVNGEDASVIPVVDVGSLLVFEYRITNSGDERLWSVFLWDDEFDHVPCLPRHLMPGDTAECTETLHAEPGPHEWEAQASAWTTGGDEVGSEVPIGYSGGGSGAVPSVNLTVLVDGQGADAPGPEVPPNATVDLTYLVANTGDLPLWSPFIWDDETGAVWCSERHLEPGEETTCSASMATRTGDGSHRVWVWAWAGDGTEATDTVEVFYRGGTDVTSITIMPLVAGQPADVAPGPRFPADGQLVWDLVATNAGTGDLWALYVEDDELGRASCPQRHLEPGESVVCSLAVTGSAGPHSGRVVAKAWSDDGERAEDESERIAFGYLPGPQLTIETYVDGFDGDSPAGPRRPVDGDLEFTYEVTNVGESDLSAVSVTDDRWGSISCPADRLGVGESMTCSIVRVMAWGNYSTTGTASGFAGTTEVTDTDPTWWHVRYAERISIIDLEVSVEGHDADDPPGPHLMTGEPIEFVYEIANLGNSALWSYYLYDPRVASGAIECEGNDNLFEGDTVVCRAFGTAGIGQYSSTVEVVAWDNDGIRITDGDSVHYRGMP